jgi:aspartate aminotransferase
MAAFLGHVGAWAPRPEQVATARFLRDAGAIRAFRARMDAGVRARLDALYSGFMELRAAGFPVDTVLPAGAIYLSLRLDLAGRRFEGRTIRTNQDIRRLLLQEAGLAVVPFQAFGLEEETGWFRISVGAVSLEDIAAALPRLRSLLQRVAAAA